ncbi:MAG: DNRLRE domain-containing protein [Deltaproteobacteria bacterium]|nr:DNRLRE domain-containing protein [Deltaproteobacteria bacterium]
MRIRPLPSGRLVVFLSTLLVAGAVVADTLVLTPTKDNTLYEDALGTLSNGAGDHLFAGRTGMLRVVRGLLEFGVAEDVPAGSTILSATLTLNMSMTNNLAGETVSLHRVDQEWGEGTSHAPMGEGLGAPATLDDATWIHTFFSSSVWTNAGGDFTAAPSASTTVTGVSFYSWSSAALAADVQSFLDDNSGNHGWILIGNETALAKRFDSRNNSPGVRPALEIEFEPPPENLPGLSSNGAVVLVALIFLTGVWIYRRA